MAIKHISAVTFAVRDMACAIEFYRKLGFVLIHGDSQARFSSLRAGEAFVNLAATSGGPVGPPFEGHWWGRAIFRVDDVDAHHQALIAAGVSADPPSDAFWGERYFHITDPDGHQLSFAELMVR